MRAATGIRSAACLAVALALASSPRARADDEDRARAHFEAGHSRYTLGDYPAALREFAAGYRLSPRPQFLVNLGQVYRRLGDLERAREMYRRFLAEAPANDRARPQVRDLVDDVEREMASRPPPPAGVAVEPAARAVEVARPAGFWRRNWWVAPVGVVALAGTIVAIAFAARSGGAGPDCGAAELGCLDLRR